MKFTCSFEQLRVTCDLYVAGHGIGEPEKIIGTTRPYADAGVRVPPVLNIAFRELPPAGQQDMLPGQLWHAVQQRQDILELVAEPECAARLVETGTAPYPATQGLVEQPAIGEQVSCQLRGCHLHGLQGPIPP